MSDCRFGVSPVNYPDPDPDVKNRCALIHFTCMVLYMCMCFFLVFIMVLYICLLSFVCLYYEFMYDTLLVGGNKEYLLTYLP